MAVGPRTKRALQVGPQVGIRVAKAMVLETRAIREAISDSAIFSVDVILEDPIDPSLPEGTATDPKQRDFRMAASSYPTSLVYGKVSPGDAFSEFLTKHGVAEADIAWVQQRVSKPDVLGCNNYPDIFKKDGAYTRKGNIPPAGCSGSGRRKMKKLKPHSYWHRRQQVHLSHRNQCGSGK